MDQLFCVVVVMLRTVNCFFFKAQQMEGDFVEEHQRQHVWEGENERSWEDLIEDDGKLVQRSKADNAEGDEDLQYLKRTATKRLKQQQGGRRWMLRSVFVCVDASQAMSAVDFKPNRLRCTVEACKTFAKAYFDENPLSTLGVLCMRRGKVEKLCGLSRSLAPVVSALDSIQSFEGSFSLQNTLQICRELFADQVLDHASREVIIVASAVNLVDPGDVYLTLSQLNKNIRVSTIHLAGQVEVFRRVSRETNGLFSVANSSAHLRDLLLQEYLTPPQASSALCHIVKMGFPAQTLKDSMGGTAVAPQPAFVTDHVVMQPFYCPQCQAAVDSIPATCRSCQLQLLSSSHLARSFHHLFPVKSFSLHASEEPCLSCHQRGKSRFQCPTCKSDFCHLCDEMIHDTLFACPGCL